MNAPTLLPVLLLGGITATLCTALVHLVRGRTMRDFLALWVIALAGFWLGHGVAVAFNAPLYTVGDLQLVAGLAGCLLALGVAVVRRK